MSLASPDILEDLDLEKLFNESVSCEYEECSNEAIWAFVCPTEGCGRQTLLCNKHKILTEYNIELARTVNIQLICSLCGADIVNFSNSLLWRKL